MQIELCTYRIFNYFEFFVFMILYFAVGVSLINHGINPINLFNILGGSILIAFLTLLIISTEKKITFYKEEIRIDLVWKTITVNYPEIECLKFVVPIKKSQHLLLRLKKRRFGKKNFVISAQNDKKALLAILNYSRKKNVPTGLNTIGEGFFTFLPEEGRYILKKEEIKWSWQKDNTSEK